MVKVKPNEPCPCGSGIKYKKCCVNKTTNIITKYETGQAESSEIIQACLTVLSNRYDKAKFINVTDDLTEITYKEYQLKNFSNNICMIAERTELNAEVFATRIDNESSNIILFHKGSYRTFSHKNVERVLESVKNLI
jgi:hypothetical protein